jgi:hypothetical protein
MYVQRNGEIEPPLHAESLKYIIHNKNKNIMLPLYKILPFIDCK